MKYLFVGDVHNHKYMFEDVKRLDAQYNFDKIIFVGDYVDDWNTTNHESLETLEIVINLKKANPDKYIFTLGNHELSYLGYPCSGHQYELDDVVEMKLKENIDCFVLAATIMCGDNEYVCSHAGFTNDYVKDYMGGLENWKESLEDMNKNIIENLPKTTLCSYMRGGASEYSSFLWADIREHKMLNSVVDPLLKYQIIGHSPVLEINLAYHFKFIDTHSTYRDGREFGDKSYLMWNENKFERVY